MQGIIAALVEIEENANAIIKGIKAEQQALPEMIAKRVGEINEKLERETREAAAGFFTQAGKEADREIESIERKARARREELIGEYETNRETIEQTLFERIIHF